MTSKTMGNPEKLVTKGTQDDDKQNKNNPEKLTTQGTRDEEKQNKNNPQKLVTQGTQDDDKQNKNNPEKLVTQGTQNEDIHIKFIAHYVLDTITGADPGFQVRDGYLKSCAERREAQKYLGYFV